MSTQLFKRRAWPETRRGGVTFRAGRISGTLRIETVIGTSVEHVEGHARCRAVRDTIMACGREEAGVLVSFSNTATCAA